MLDPKLSKYATNRQWEILEAVEKEGSGVKAAKALGISPPAISITRKAVLYKAAQNGYSPKEDLNYPVPPGQRVKGISSLINKETGETTRQWVKTEADKEQQEIIFRAAIEAMCSDLPKAKLVKQPESTNSELLVVLPVGDHHFGMLAWGEETLGKDYNIKIAENLLCGAMDYLIDVSPQADEAAILILGDFLHYDGMVPVTPGSGHMLDADTRFQHVVRTALRSIRFLVNSALSKYGHVRLILEVGNHDQSMMPAFTEMFYMHYDDEPRITVDRSPHNCHAFTFGKNLIATHHGDKIKTDRLPLIIATDYAEMWGTTEHRVVHTGHVHHDHLKEHPGLMTESHGILAPKDAYASKGGWRARQSMKSITYHKEYGEVGRLMFTPNMLK